MGLILGFVLAGGMMVFFGLAAAVLGGEVGRLVVKNLGVFLQLGWLLGITFGLGLAPVLGLGFGLLGTRSVLITSRTPKEAHSRSLMAALTWLVSGLIGGLVVGLIFALKSLAHGPELPLVALYRAALSGLGFGLVLGLVLGLDLALRNGGWFVLLQKVAHRRLARAGNFPPNPYDFLEWGVDRQIFRRVGGGVRFRHNLIQQHLAISPDDVS